jgi:hypothetical protein
MIRIFKLIILLVISQVAFGQAPSNYTNINGRYRWIAGMFDSTFHIPKGATPSLRIGGSTNAGGLFYNTADSSVYTYTGTQWIKARGSINPQDTTNKYVTQVYKKNGSDSVFYVKGGVHTWAFNDSTGSPGGGGGGKIYYFNGGVSMGTFGGFTMYELGDTANTGTAANFTRATTGNIANFITDPGKPGLLQIPAGVWSIDAYLSETGGGSNNAEIYVQVEKWDGSTITTIATSPIEQITNGSVIDLYTWSVSIPTTALAVTDRIIIQFYIQNTNGKTVTLYTQNGYVGEVHTTFTTGIGAINGLTAPAQYLVTGTSGTDFNINSATATHTFNLPTASSTNRGALSTTDWTTFNSKIGGSGTTNYISKFTASGTIGNSLFIDNGTAVGLGTAPSNAYLLSVAGIYRGIGVGDAQRIELTDSQAAGATVSLNPQFGLGVGAVGTYGSFPFAFFTNSSEKARITTAGNFGIGLSSPDSMLTVNLGTHLKRGVRMSALPTGAGTKALRIDANGTISIADTLANGISGTGTTNYIPKFTNSSAIGNSVIYEASGSIGINTTSPAIQGFNRELTISAGTSGNVRAGISIQGSRTTASTIGALSFYNQSNLVTSIETERGGDDATGTMLFLTNNSGSLAERMRLTSTGLGIGTSSPNTLLSLVGNHASGQSILKIQSSTAYSSSGLSSIGFNDSDGTRKGIIYVNSDGLQLETGTSTSILFNPNGNTKMRLDASGNLGLGVTPSAWGGNARVLEGANGSALTFNSAAPETAITSNAYYNGSNWIYKTSDEASRYSVNGYNGSHTWEVAASGTAGNAITFTQAMTLDASGNLGIGVTSMSYKLQVAGVINTTNTSGYLLRDGDVAGYGIFKGSTTRIGIAANGNEYLSVTSGGNVGIGTTSPNARLSLGTGTTSKLLVYDGGTIAQGGNGFFAGFAVDLPSGNDFGMYAHNNGSIVFGKYTNNNDLTNVTERMRITSAGLVGIGTSSPTSLLEVYGTGGSNPNAVIKVTGTTNYAFFRTTNSSGDFYIGTDNSTGTGFGLGAYSRLIYSEGAYPMIFATNGSERMRITSAGELLINTTSDAGDYKLQVNGDIYLTGSGDARLFMNNSSASGNNFNFNSYSNGNLYLQKANGATNLGVFDGGTGAYTALSDSSQKKDFELSTLGLNAIIGLKPTLYRMKDESNTSAKHLGFIAQEVKDYIPQAYVENGNFIGLNYNAIIPVLVNAIKELKAEIETLKNK